MCQGEIIFYGKKVRNEEIMDIQNPILVAQSITNIGFELLYQDFFSNADAL